MFATELKLKMLIAMTKMNTKSMEPQVEVRNDHIEEEEEAKAPQLGRGRRMRTPTDHYQADFSNIMYN